MPRMDVYEALYTTRAMRRVKPDPIPFDVQKRILDAAVRAPSGGNTQNWRFLLVDDPDVKAAIGPIYRECLGNLWTTYYKPRVDAAAADPALADSVAFVKMRASAQHLADHFEGYPLMLFGFAKGDPSGGSIFPAVWSAQLAARAEGVGSALTSVLTFRAADVLDILGVPADEHWHMACCITFGYPTGKWGVPGRVAAHAVANRNRWDNPVGFEINEPLWP
jgi:nitroreductase